MVKIKIHILRDPIVNHTFQDKAVSCSNLAFLFYMIMLDDIYFNSQYSQNFNKDRVMKKMNDLNTRTVVMKELLNKKLISLEVF